MKTIVLWLAALAALAATSSPAATWLTDLPEAQARAKAENKLVLLNFTGSDWCGWCIRLKKEVFSQPEFEKFADENLVLVEIDFPKKKLQVRVLRETNEGLAEQYKVEGFPTVVVLNSEGLKLGTLGYEEGGAKNYIAQLKKFASNKASAAGASKPARPGTAPALKGAEPAPSSELTLRGISGPKQKRLALINDQTFAAGEAGIIRCGDRREKIRCVEIGEKSVVIVFAGSGERKELRLREGL